MNQTKVFGRKKTGIARVALAFAISFAMVFTMVFAAFADEPPSEEPPDGGGMPFPSFWMSTAAPGGAAVYVSGGAIVSEKTQNASIFETSYSGITANPTSASGVELASTKLTAAGIVVTGGSDYTLGGTGTAISKNDLWHYNGSAFVMTGSGIFDSAIDLGVTSSGLDTGIEAAPYDNYYNRGGTGVFVGPDSTLTLDSVYVKTDGTVRYSALNDGNGKLIVKDSYLESTGEAPGYTTVDGKPIGEFFVADALLIYGTSRTNMTVGTGKAYYVNSDVVAEGWAALSTDSAGEGGLDLYAYGTNAIARNGGYGAYADFTCRDNLFGSNLVSPELGLILANDGNYHIMSAGDYDDTTLTDNNIHKSGSTELEKKLVDHSVYDADFVAAVSGAGIDDSTPSKVIAGRNAIQIHAPDMGGSGIDSSTTGYVTVKDSTLKTDANLYTLGKKNYKEKLGDAVQAYIDHVKGSAVLVKSTSAFLDFDDATVEPYNGVIVHTVINSDSMGNFLKPGDADNEKVDNINVSLKGGTYEGDLLHEDYQRYMYVTVDGSGTKLEGDIVSGTYADWKKLWADEEVTEANWLPDTSWSTFNGAQILLTGGAIWTPDEKSTLSKLSINDTAKIEAPTGKGVALYVNDVPMIESQATIAATDVPTALTGTITVQVEPLPPSTTPDDVGGTLAVTDGDSLDALKTALESAPQAYDKITVGADAADDLLAAADEGLLTLTVDGVERKVASGKTYVSEKNSGVVLTRTAWFSPLGKLGTQDGSGRVQPEAYRSALFLEDGKVSPKSAISAVQGGTYSATSIDDVKIQGGENSTAKSASPQFGALFVSGGDPVTVEDTTIELLSDAQGKYDKTNQRNSETNDFVGLGSAVAMYNGADVTLENVDIHTTGVAKPALYSDSSRMLFKNSSYNVEGGKLYDGYVNSAAMAYMVAPPWVLGISGNARGSNLVGDDTVNVFLDSDMKAKAWGVVSSDSGSNGVIDIINSDVTLTSDTGYGIYVIGGVKETFYGANFDVATYAVIGTGGTAKFTSLAAGQKIDVPKSAVSDDLAYDDLQSSYVGATKPTKVDSQFGVMAHNSTDFILEKGTVFDTQNASFLMKSGTDTIKVDNSKLNPKDGILLQVIDNDDSTVGVAGANMEFMPDFNTSFYEKAGWPAAVTQSQRDAAAASGGGDGPGGEGPGGEGPGPGAGDPPSVTATFTNTALTGDMFNASGYGYISGSSSADTSYADPKPMAVTLGSGATLNGNISLSRSMHVWMDWIADKNDSQGGHYAYRTAKKGTSGEGGVFTVDGKNYVQATSFTIDNYYNLGHVINEPGAYAEGATAEVTVKDGAVWTLDGDSYLTKLNVSGGKVEAQAGKVLQLTVDGAVKVTASEITSGDYAGVIVLKNVEPADETPQLTETPKTSAEVAAVKTAPGATTKLPASYTFADGTSADVVWTSGDASVAKIVDGSLVGVKEGKVTLTVASTTDPSKTETVSVIIAKNVTKVRTALTTLYLKKGTKLAPAVLADSVTGGKTDTKALLTYKSNNTKIAKVDAKGNITAVRKGKATITATTLNNRWVKINVNVVTKAKALKGFKIKGAKSSLKVKKTLTLKVAPTPGTATNLKPTFKSSNKKIATVDAAGKVTAVKAGKAKITIKIGKKKVVKTIQVKK